MNNISHERIKPPYDTEKWGAGAYEKDAGINGPEDYLRTVIGGLRFLLLLPFKIVTGMIRKII